MGEVDASVITTNPWIGERTAMPYLIVLGVVAVYSGIGLAVRKKYYPRASIPTALAWPLVFGMGQK